MRKMLKKLNFPHSPRFLGIRIRYLIKVLKMSQRFKNTRRISRSLVYFSWMSISINLSKIFSSHLGNNLFNFIKWMHVRIFSGVTSVWIQKFIFRIPKILSAKCDKLLNIFHALWCPMQMRKFFLGKFSIALFQFDIIILMYSRFNALDTNLVLNIKLSKRDETSNYLSSRKMRWNS